MKILFVWTGVTSYMADCWRELQQLDGVELKVVVERVDSGRDFDAARVLHDLDFELVEKGKISGFGFQKDGWTPDVIFCGGWRSANTRRVVDAFPAVPKTFCLDMPWRWSLRCIVARWVLHPFLRKFDRIYVPGKLSARYARWLGFPRNCISRDLYSVRFDRFDGPVPAERKGFLYLGRFAPEKRIDLLQQAYARYRELGGTWSFDLYGSGDLTPPSLSPIPYSLSFHPFAQPDELTQVYLSHACVVMASAFDPWPLVIAESTAAGLSVIASDRCGNGEELGVRRIPFGDVEAMAREMLAVERMWESDPAGRPSVGSANPFAARYDCSAWAKRTRDLAFRMRRIRGYCPGMDDAANGMAVVARLLMDDERFRDEFVVHGLWRPRGWLACLLHLRNYVRMTHGSLSPLYLEHQGKWKKRLVKPIELFFLRQAKKILVTCEAEREWVEKYLGKRDEGRGPVIEVVDLKRYFRFGGDCAKPDDARDARRVGCGQGLNVLYLGRRHPLKGVEYLERAVSELKRSGDRRSAGIELRIVSDAVGEEKEKVWDWCDVLCLPTLSENFGLVVAEALERGKRVIVTDGAPAWEPTSSDSDDRLLYVRGYRDGDEATRVRLLKEAIKAALDRENMV